ncbi:hypothetical protein [Kitasatospora acidiphila]|uniref:hypothetical protein n=1 Tax=Kitasatospora acidiphila TaxID=2567942 RepID=UPI003C70DAA4
MSDDNERAALAAIGNYVIATFTLVGAFLILMLTLFLSETGGGDNWEFWLGISLLGLCMAMGGATIARQIQLFHENKLTAADGWLILLWLLHLAAFIIALIPIGFFTSHHAVKHEMTNPGQTSTPTARASSGTMPSPGPSDHPWHGHHRDP